MDLQEKVRKYQTTSKELPTADSSELYLIGAAMLMESAALKIYDQVRFWHFYNKDNQLIWKAIHKMINSKKPITKDLVYLELNKMAYWTKEIDEGHLLLCIKSVGVGIESIKKQALVRHIELVRETYTRRQMIDCAATMLFRGFNANGSTTQMMTTFENRKNRINEAFELGNLQDDIKECKYDPNSEIELEDWQFTYNGIGLAEAGNIVTVSGGEGSRKTAILTAIISSAFGNPDNLGFNLQHRGKKILFFDTEQPKKRFNHTQRRLDRMCRGRNTEKVYEAYRLRKKDVEGRIHFIDKIVQKNSGNIFAIIIDGLLDLVSSMNSEEEATKVTQQVMSWTEEENAIAFCVLHDVKSTNKMGGMIGSYQARKQDTEINCQLAEDEDFTIVKFRKTRGGKKPKPFQFTQDGNGTPILEDHFRNLKTGTDDCPFI
jgi:hypothetical protein